MALGSFATVLVHRIPRAESWALGRAGEAARFTRSQCPDCHTQLGIQDLIPVFSFLFLKGKCRHCSATIPRQYLWVELTTILLCWGFLFSTATWPWLLFLCLLTPFLTALFYIDLKHYILPDILVIILAGLFFLQASVLTVFAAVNGFLNLQYLANLWGMPLLSAICYGGFSWLLRFGFGTIMNKEVMGLGDVKFFAMAGLWLGVAQMPFFLFIAGAVGTIMGLVYKYLFKEGIFPFGPALIAAFYINLLLYFP